MFKHVQYREGGQASTTQEYGLGLGGIDLPRQRVGPLQSFLIDVPNVLQAAKAGHLQAV